MPFFYFALCLFCLSCQQKNYSEAMIEDCLILDQTIRKQNRIIEHFIQSELAYFEEQTQFRPALQVFANKAKEAISISNEMDRYLNKLREQIIYESGGRYTEEEAQALGNAALKGQVKNPSNQNTIHRIFISNAKQSVAQILVQKIQALKASYIHLVADLWADGGIKGTIFQDSSKKAIALNRLTHELAFGIYDNNNWSEKTFNQKPLAAVLPILSKIKSDLLTSESAVVSFLISQFAITPLYYDKFEVFAQSVKPHIRLGEQYESEIALGTYASQTPFKVRVDGKNLDIVDGKAQYTITPKTIGQKTYQAQISIYNEATQQTSTFTKEFHFEVIP